MTDASADDMAAEGIGTDAAAVDPADPSPPELEDEDDQPARSSDADVVDAGKAADDSQPAAAAPASSSPEKSDDESTAAGSDGDEADSKKSDEADPTELLLRATTHKEEGNAHFKSGDFVSAVRSYRGGVNLLKKINSNDEQVQQLLITLQTNLSTVCYKQGKHRMSRDVASKALEVDARNIKALYRRAVACRAMLDFDAARVDLREALKVDPENAAVKKELAGIKKQVEGEKAKEKARLKKAFSKSGSSLLYSDKEEEERKRAEKVKEEARMKEEENKRRRVMWEDENVRRMSSDPPEEAISFEDWDKQQKKAEEQAEKARKKEEQERRRKEREAKKNARKDEHSDDDDDELTERELAALRGYKKTSDGRTTSYFNREQSEEEKKLIGCIKPKRLDDSVGSGPLSPSPTAATDSGVGSVWNREGTTWEERDTTDWCKRTLERCLLDTTSAHYSTTTDDATYVAVVKKVKEVKGDASVAIAGGKKRYIYDFHVSGVEYEILDDGEEVVAKGKLGLPDVNSATTADENELEVDVPAWKKVPQAGKDNVHVVRDAEECRNMLVREVRKSVLRFAEEFGKNF